MKKFWMPEKWRFFIFLIFLTVSHFFIITETSNVRVIVENLSEYPRKYRNLFSLEQDDDQIALQMVWILDPLTKIKQFFYSRLRRKKLACRKDMYFFIRNTNLHLPRSQQFLKITVENIGWLWRKRLFQEWF